MARLDFNYISELVKQAQGGDSNAFAELFAATYQKEYAFARTYLKDDYLAQEALQGCYIHALKNLSKLREPGLVVAWLNQLTLRGCLRIQSRGEEGAEAPENRIISIKQQKYSVRQILTLPFSEAQAILLRHLCGMRKGAIASLLEIRKSEVRRYIDSGLRRLKHLSGTKGGASA